MPLSNPTTLPVATTVGSPKNTALDTTASKVLMPANPLRLGCIINNTASANLYVALGVTASATNYVAIVAPGGYYEVPFNWVGDVDAIIVSKTNVSGNVIAIELT